MFIYKRRGSTVRVSFRPGIGKQGTNICNSLTTVFEFKYCKP